MDLLLELARIGANVAVRLDALGADLPILQQATTICELGRSVRLCAQLAYKLSQPLPPRPAQKPPVPSPAGPPARRDAETPDAGRKDADRGDRETRETERAERLEDPAREHNLDRPFPVLIKEIKRGLDAGALPGCTLRGATEEAISLAIRMAARDEPPGLNGVGFNGVGFNGVASNGAGLNRAARRKLACQPRAHPSG